MKKILSTCFLCIMTALFLLGAASCAETKSIYTVTFKDWDGTVLYEQTLAEGEVPAYEGNAPSRAATAEFTYTFAGWKGADGVILDAFPAVTAHTEYTAAYNAVKNQYAVRFVCEGVTLEEKTLEYGSAVEYRGEEPQKAATAEYTFLFDGWTDGTNSYAKDEALPVLTGETEYTAVFKTDKNEYKVMWSVEGTVTEGYFAYGTKAEYAGETPSKDKTAQYTYAFAGWARTEGGEVLDAEEMTVTGEVTFYAVFSSTVNRYAVKFVNEGTELSSETLEYGTVPAYEGQTPVKISTAQYDYVFAGWNDGQADYSTEDTLPAVTGEATYTAIFTPVLRQYNVHWVIDGADNTVAADYGTVPAYAGTPSKPSTEDYEYHFKGWSLTEGGELVDLSEFTVDGEKTFYAVFEEVKKQFTVTFSVDGTETSYKADKGSVPFYEGTPVKESDPQYNYTFAGWSLSEDGEVIELSSQIVDRDIVYYAVFTAAEREYLVAFYVDGNVKEERYFKYNETPVFSGEAPVREETVQYTYEFAGWSLTENGEVVDLSAEKVAQDTEYFAIFNETLRNYTLRIDYNLRDGGAAGEPLELSLAYGTQYGKDQTATPEKEGYLPDQFFVSGVMEGDVSYTVTYSACDVWDGSVADAFAGGSGTAEDPYLIATGAQLAYLSELSRNVSYGQDQYYRLTSSIDLNNLPWTPICFNGGTNTTYKWFWGNFDGDGYTIANMSYDNTGLYAVGLFAASKGNIYDLTIHGTISAKNRIGGLVYYLQSGTVSNIRSYVDITSAEKTGVVGGVVGVAEKTSTISGCSYYGNITTTAASTVTVGGIVGSFKTTSVISDCVNYGNIRGNISSVGGVVGAIADSSAVRCVNYGTLEGDMGSCGGIAGKATASQMEACVNYGTVSSIAEGGMIGGIVGNCYSAGMSVTDCKNYGNITGTVKVGGIAGYNTQLVSGCENHGTITATVSEAGGIVGQYGGTIESCDNYGDVYTALYGGGIIGSSYKATVQDCNNYGAVRFLEDSEGDGKGFGGICGWITTTSSISGCTNYGDVWAKTNVGGIGGYLGAGSTVTDCVNQGTADGNSYVDDLIGFDNN